MSSSGHVTLKRDSTHNEEFEITLQAASLQLQESGKLSTNHERDSVQY